MEFWIGLSVGMHLGKILAGYLEKFGMAHGLLSEETSQNIVEIEQSTREIGEFIDAVSED